MNALAERLGGKLAPKKPAPLACRARPAVIASLRRDQAEKNREPAADRAARWQWAREVLPPAGPAKERRSMRMAERQTAWRKNLSGLPQSSSGDSPEDSRR